MILIRGIKGEDYARKIEKGIVDCRDILSSLLRPPVTGYEYSDYYEKNFVKALSFFTKENVESLFDPSFLYSILTDYYVPHIYLTYFHILNERSLEWLEKFDNDYQFIAINVKIDKLTGCAIGNEYFGSRMSYVGSIRELSQDGTSSFYAACMCSLENLFKNKEDMMLSLQIYNTLAFPLLCREQDGRFTDIENEFRIIAYDCPRIRNGKMKQVAREISIFGESGIIYKGTLNAGENSVLVANIRVLNQYNKLLSDIIMEEKGKITLESQFKSINICDISDDYRYLGGKKECKKYIKQVLKCKPEDIFVNRTILRQYNIKDLPNIRFMPGYQKVKY